MSYAWAVHLPTDKAHAASALRLIVDIEVLAVPDGLWLGGTEMTDPLDLELRKLPGGRRFKVDREGTLTPQGSRLPAGRLPVGEWMPLSQWFVPAAPVAALSGMPAARVKLSFVRTGHAEPATVLLASWKDFSAYALSAPLVRLKPLRFALAPDGRTVLRGQPLPPLAGRRYVESTGIAVPCGWTIRPALDPVTLRGILGTSTEDLALFDEDGTWEWLAADDFVNATRASARATQARMCIS